MEKGRSQLLGQTFSASSKREGRQQDQPHDLELFYDVHVFCCVNERPPKHRRGCCSGKGSRQLCDYMCRRAMALGLNRVRVNHAGCLNRCELGPTLVIYPEGVWYTYNNERDIEEILSKHVKGGQIIERLLLRPHEGPRH